MGLAIFFQRRRKMMVRAAALMALCLGGVLAVLPRADAYAAMAPPVNPKAYLLSPHAISGAHFSVFYPLTHH